MKIDFTNEEIESLIKNLDRCQMEGYIHFNGFACSALDKLQESIEIIKDSHVIFDDKHYDLKEMIEKAKNSEFGAIWYSNKGPIEITKEGKLIPLIYGENK